MDHYGYADALRDAVQSLSTKEAQDMLFDCLLSDTQKGELLIRALPTTPPRAVAESFARTMLSILRELSDRLREDAAKPTLAFFLPTNIDHYLKLEETRGIFRTGRSAPARRRSFSDAFCD